MADPTQRLMVRAGRAQVAMAADGVAEVIRTPRITRVPHGPPGLLGVAHLRGAVLPVVSLGQLLGAGEQAQATRVVVLRRDPPIGLAVEAVDALKAAGEGESTPQHGQLMLNDDSGARWFDMDAALQFQFAAFRSTARAPQPEQAKAPPAPAIETSAFLGFTLEHQSYAFPLDAVAEVFAVPGAIVTMPHTEAALLGVFALRGNALPVVSLRALLGLPTRPLTGDERVIVVRLGAQQLALLVDGVSAIVRAPKDALQPAPSLFNRGGGEARIDSVLPQDGGGVLSILTPARILADDRIAALLTEATDQKDNPMTGATSTAARTRFLVIHLGDERYGLPIAAVDEVVRLPDKLTRLPKAPAYVLGVMNLRGRVIPVIDQGARFAAVGPRGAAKRVVVVTLGRLQAGFAVDAASQILEIDSVDLLPAPELSEGQERMFDRVAKVDREGNVILLIDPQALLDRAEADLLSDLTAKSKAP